MITCSLIFVAIMLLWDKRWINSPRQHAILPSIQPSSTATKLGKDKSSTGTRLTAVATMTPQEEWALLQKLEHTTRVITPRVARLRRKLQVRRVSFQGLHVFK